MDEQPFWFHPDAYAEVLSAHDRYAEVTIELAERFQDELERSRQAIARNPLTWPAYLCGTQRYLMKSFPYFIVFRVAKNRIWTIQCSPPRAQRPCSSRFQIRLLNDLRYPSTSVMGPYPSSTSRIGRPWTVTSSL